MRAETTAALAEERIRASAATIEAAARSRLPGGRLRRRPTLIADSLRAGGKLLVFGNGGSAADATHIAAEFVGRFLVDRRALPALSLSDNASAVTAIGNDYGFERVFARQVEALGARRRRRARDLDQRRLAERPRRPSPRRASSASRPSG